MYVLVTDCINTLIYAVHFYSMKCYVLWTNSSTAYTNVCDATDKYTDAPGTDSA